MKYIKRYPFIFFVSYRILNSLLLQTLFEPDEIWQNLEPINFLLLKKGEMTWDWILGLRSFNYSLVYYIPQYILHIFFKTHYQTISFISYKIVSGVLAGINDYFSFKLFMLYSNKIDNFLFLTVFSHGLWLYSSRSHVNSFEMMLCVVITYLLEIYRISKVKNKKNLDYAIILLVFVVYIRPTSLFFVGPLFIPFIRECILKIYLIFPIIFSLFYVDYLVYGEIVFPAYNFYRLNIYYGVSELFGNQPWYSHFLFMFILSGLLFLSFMKEFYKILQAHVCNLYEKYIINKQKSLIKKDKSFGNKKIGYRYKNNNIKRHKSILSKERIVCACIGYLFTYSLIKHKEMRFLIPILPFINIISASKLNNFIKKTVIIQFFVCIFIGMYHQNYLKTIAYVNSITTNNKNVNICYLTCPYSLPAYSYLSNKNINIKTLSANPDIYSKVSRDKVKHYKRFGDKIVINEFENFIDGGYKKFEYNKYDLILIYDWLYKMCKPYMRNFRIIKKIRYSWVIFEKEKGKIIYVMERAKDLKI